MSEEEEVAVEVSAEEAVGEGWKIDGLRSAEWAMRKIVDEQRRIEELEMQAKEWAADIERWRKRVLARPNQTIEFFTGHLTRWALDQRELDPKMKTVVLPSGEVKTRQAKDRVVVVDADRVLDWARANLPDAVATTVVEKVKVAELTGYVMNLDENSWPTEVDEETGEILPAECPVPGIRIEAEHVTATVVPNTSSSAVPDAGEEG